MTATTAIHPKNNNSCSIDTTNTNTNTAIAATYLQYHARRDIILKNRKAQNACRLTRILTGVLTNTKSKKNPTSGAGSSLVRIGETQVLASVHFSIGTACIHEHSNTNNNKARGEVDVNFEYAFPFHNNKHSTSDTAIAAATATGGATTIASAETIQGLLTKTLNHNPTVFDLRTLAICNNHADQHLHLAWKVTIHLVCLNHDGNVLDAAMLAAVAALRNTVVPTVIASGSRSRSRLEDDDNHHSNSNSNNGVVQLQLNDDANAVKLQLLCTPVSLTIGIYNCTSSSATPDYEAEANATKKRFIVDPTAEEEAVLSGSVTVVMSAEDGMVLDVLKCTRTSAAGQGGAMISAEELAMCMQLGVARAKEVAGILCT